MEWDRNTHGWGHGARVVESRHRCTGLELWVQDLIHHLGLQRHGGCKTQQRWEDPLGGRLPRPGLEMEGPDVTGALWKTSQERVQDSAMSPSFCSADRHLSLHLYLQ